MLPFVVHLLEKHQHKFAGCGGQSAFRTACLLEAGRAAWNFQIHLNNMKGWPTHSDRQAVLDAIVRFNTMCDTAGMKLVPKNHMMVFLGYQHVQHKPRQLHHWPQLTFCLRTRGASPDGEPLFQAFAWPMPSTLTLCVLAPLFRIVLIRGRGEMALFIIHPV